MGLRERLKRRTSVRRDETPYDKRLGVRRPYRIPGATPPTVPMDRKPEWDALPREGEADGE